ncbi:MAG: alpha-glucosidase/alpha-galactosidase [Bacteroidota bacterium]
MATSHSSPTHEPPAKGFPGKVRRPFTVTMLGAGSWFTPRLMNDILRIPGLDGGEIRLVDIDRDRLAMITNVIRILVERLGRTGWTVKASPSRRRLLPGTDYLINCIEVSGVECVRHDNDIPARYGIDQCIGDTIGPGGLFKGLRTIPVWLDILRDAEELAPDALVLNYTNPMNMLCLAAGRSSRLPFVGLCHSVQATSRLLAHRAEVEYEEMLWECAGINHLAWFTSLVHKGKNLYPFLMEKARKDLHGTPADPDDAVDLVRKDIMLHFGAFPTESSGHLSEYLPYYRKRRDLIRRYCRSGYEGGSGFYAREWPGWRKAADRERKKMVEGKLSPDWPRSLEYASWIIEAREKDVPFRFHGNVMNSTSGSGPLVGNLPHDGCVEVACLADRNGIRPIPFGMLPPQMAALCDWNMRMFDMAVRAAMEKSKEAAIQALLLDPLTAAVLSPAEISAMTLEMFRAERDFLPGYR